MNNAHLSDLTLLSLVTARRTHPHLDRCAFCREQYEALLDLERFEHAPPQESATTRNDHEPLRLAAQSEEEVVDDGPLLRRTWYLDSGNVLLRVFEEDERLVGYLICAPERLARLRLHIAELHRTFVTDKRGRFVIGDCATAIEPMHVTLEELSQD